MKRIIDMKTIIVLILSVFFLSSCAYYQVSSPNNPDFKRKSTSGELRTGMTEQEIRQLFGDPKEKGERKTIYDVRSVWTYKQYRFWENPVWHPVYLAGCVATYGLTCFIPADKENHYLVFSDGILIGWDLPDPYAPDLVVEKRIRIQPPLEGK